MNLSDFIRGWIVGDFEPSLVKTKDVEIGLLHLKAGTKSDGHWHERHEEYNIILEGSAILGGDRVYTKGDIFEFWPFERSFVEYPVDTTLLVIKAPSTKGDKHYA